MFKFSSVLLFFLLLVPLSQCQVSSQNSASGTITTAGSGCSPSTNCVVLPLALNSGGASVAVSQTFSGTLNFEGAGGDGLFTALAATPLAGGSAVTTATSAGTWTVGTVGLSFIRVRASALASGSPAIVLKGSTASVNLGGSGSGGGVSSVSCVSGCTVTNPTTTPAITVTASGGNVTGPVSSTTNDAACFGNTSGQLLADCGGPLPATLANASHEWINSFTQSTGLFTQTRPAISDLTATFSAPLNLTTNTLSITGAAGEILAGSTPAFTATPALGTDNSVAGTLQLSNSAANAHNIFGSAATTSNTILGFATAPTTGDLIDCVTSSTTCTLTDAGVLAANVTTNSVNYPSNSVTYATGNHTQAGSLNLTWVSPTLTVGASGTAGAITEFNNTQSTTWASGATTSNTIKGFTAVPTTGDLVDCTSASTTCTLTDAGILAANVTTNSVNYPSNSVVYATGNHTQAGSLNLTWVSPTLTVGASGTAGAITEFNNTQSTTWSSGATTSNTIAGFTAVPVTTDLVSCTSVSTTCTLTDSGVAVASLSANPMTTLGDMIYGGASGAETRLAGPTAAGTYSVVEKTSSGAATAETFGLAGVIPNAQTGATYTYLQSDSIADRSGYTTFSNAGSIAVTLPAAGSTGFSSNWVNGSCDIGAGTATITPTTSTISYSTGSAYISAASTMTLTTGQCAFIYSDNINYFAIKFSGGSGGVSSLTGDGTVITNSTSTGAVTLTIAGTSGGIPYFSSTSGWASSALLASEHVLLGGGSGTAPSSDAAFDDGSTTSNWLTYTGTGGLALTGSGSVLTVGSSPPSCTYGTGGAFCSLEGSNPTAAATLDQIVGNSTDHTFLVSQNGASGGTNDSGGATFFPMQINVVSNYTAASQTLAVTDYYAECNRGSAIAIILPVTGIAIGKQYVVKELGVGACTISATSGNIDGQSSLVLSQLYTSYTFIWDGTSWFII